MPNDSAPKAEFLAAAAPAESPRRPSIYAAGDQELEVDPVRDQITMFVPSDAVLLGGSLVNELGIALNGQVLCGSVIALDGTLLVAPGAAVRSSGKGHRLHGRRVVIAGNVEIETVQADELLVIAPTARIATRNLIYGRIALRAGAAAKVDGGRFSQFDSARDPLAADVARQVLAQHMPVRCVE